MMAIQFSNGQAGRESAGFKDSRALTQAPISHGELIAAMEDSSRKKDICHPVELLLLDKPRIVSKFFPDKSVAADLKTSKASDALIPAALPDCSPLQNQNDIEEPLSHGYLLYTLTTPRYRPCLQEFTRDFVLEIVEDLEYAAERKRNKRQVADWIIKYF